MIPAEKLFFSTVCLSHHMEYTEALERYEEAGLDRIELGYCQDADASPGALAADPAVEAICHNYFLPDEPRFINLASGDEDVRAWSIGYVERAIDFCAEHGVDLYSFHGGFRVDPAPGPIFDGEPIPREEAFANFLEGVEEVASYAADRDVTLGIENNVVEQHHLDGGENRTLLFCRPGDFERLFDAIDAPNVGLLLDLGHLRVASTTLGFDPGGFGGLSDRLVGVHLHDNDGDADRHRPPGPEGWAAGYYDEWLGDHPVPVVVEAHYDDVETLLASRDRLIA